MHTPSRTDRRPLSIALGVSVALHAALFAFVTIDVPTFDEGATARPLEVVDLDAWEDAAFEVVTIASLETPRDAEAQPSSAAASAERPEAGAPGAVIASAPLRVIAPEAAGPATRALAPVTARPTPPVDSRPANRGVLLVSGDAPASPVVDYDFAREEDGSAPFGRQLPARGRDGSGGIGVTIRGPGGDCEGSGLGGIDLRGPGGGLPAPKGLGIIGDRPPGGEAINRSLPGRQR